MTGRRTTIAHRRMVRFIDALFERLPVLQSTAGNHPKWKEMSLSGTVPGWEALSADAAKDRGRAGRCCEPTAGRSDAGAHRRR